jgi:membrane protease YdiL (CAAX protease family)
LLCPAGFATDDSRGDDPLGGGAGEGLVSRIEGWSSAPLGARLPALGLVALLGIAAVARFTAPFVCIGILFAYLVTRRYSRRSVVLAAVLPAAAVLVWRAIPQPIADLTGADCANLLAPPAVWRFLEAAVGLAAVLLLLWDRRARLAEIGLTRGSRRLFVASIAGLAVIGPVALYLAAALGETELGRAFFGPFALDVSQPLAFLPALVFAASNSLAEELAYRGALRTWLTPSLGVTGANLAQAVVFGLAHTGEDFVGIEAVIPTMLAMIAVGFVAGIVARRTGSLTLPLAIHAAADIPIYFYWACQVA